MKTEDQIWEEIVSDWFFSGLKGSGPKQSSPFTTVNGHRFAFKQCVDDNDGNKMLAEARGALSDWYIGHGEKISRVAGMLKEFCVLEKNSG